LNCVNDMKASQSEPCDFRALKSSTQSSDLKDKDYLDGEDEDARIGMKPVGKLTIQTGKEPWLSIHIPPRFQDMQPRTYARLGSRRIHNMFANFLDLPPDVYKVPENHAYVQAKSTGPYYKTIKGKRAFLTRHMCLLYEDKQLYVPISIQDKQASLHEDTSKRVLSFSYKVKSPEEIVFVDLESDKEDSPEDSPLAMVHQESQLSDDNNPVPIVDNSGEQSNVPTELPSLQATTETMEQPIQEEHLPSNGSTVTDTQVPDPSPEQSASADATETTIPTATSEDSPPSTENLLPKRATRSRARKGGLSKRLADDTSSEAKPTRAKKSRIE